MKALSVRGKFVVVLKVTMTIMAKELIRLVRCFKVGFEIPTARNTILD